MSAVAHMSVTHRGTLRTIARPGLLRRLAHRLVRWRQRQVEHDIAIRLGLTGGRLTDDIERRMTERLINGGGFRG